MKLVYDNNEAMSSKQKIQEAFERTHSPTKMSTPSKPCSESEVNINTIDTRTLAPNSKYHHESFSVSKTKHVSNFPSLAF